MCLSGNVTNSDILSKYFDHHGINLSISNHGERLLTGNFSNVKVSMIRLNTCNEYDVHMLSKFTEIVKSVTCDDNLIHLYFSVDKLTNWFHNTIATNNY